jgi:hypothetical protein
MKRPQNRIKLPLGVKTCVMTCEWYPSQREGVTTGRRPIYVRYRHGYLSVRIGQVGQTIDDAIRSGREIVGCAVGDNLDGAMAYEELRRHTRGIVVWPKKKPPKRPL